MTMDRADQPGTIVVNGTGRVAVQPDVADVRLGVAIVRPTVAAARADGATTMAAILVAVTAAGVERRDVRTALLSVQPRYDYRDGRAPELAGYELSNLVQVTVRDLARLADVVDGALTAGATSLDELSFRVDDPAPSERAARLAAMAVARERADVLLTSGGVSMGTRDLIKPLLAELGTVHFGRIAFKPGKPTTFATVRGKLAFGLPGYPVSSLVSFDFRMDEWKVDVVVGGSQKGLMLPPGMSFTGVSEKAWNAAQSALNPRRYWDWRNLVENKRQARFCGTAPIHFFYGLEASLAMIEEEGLDNIFTRHRRLADATRACVKAWAAGGGPDVYPVDPADASDSLTAVLMPKGHNAEDVRRIAETRFNVALGRGLGGLDGKVFRIGHMGDLNEPTVLGALASVEMALKVAKVPHGKGGLDAAMASLAA